MGRTALPSRATRRDKHLCRCAGFAIAPQPPRCPDILRTDPGRRERYADVKKQAAATAANIDEYGRAKNAVVQQIFAAAGLTDAERASIDTNQVRRMMRFPDSSPAHRIAASAALRMWNWRLGRVCFPGLHADLQQQAGNPRRPGASPRCHRLSASGPLSDR